MRNKVRYITSHDTMDVPAALIESRDHQLHCNRDDCCKQYLKLHKLCCCRGTARRVMLRRYAHFGLSLVYVTIWFNVYCSHIEHCIIVHIIKTTASIPTKFCTVIKTTKCPSWVVPAHALQIQDGGRPPSWKNRKIK